MKEEKFPNSRKPSHPWVYGEFWDLRAQHNWEEKKIHTHTHTHTQNMCLTTTPSGEVAQILTPATSERGLDRGARAACLG